MECTYTRYVAPAPGRGGGRTNPDPAPHTRTYARTHRSTKRNDPAVAASWTRRDRSTGVSSSPVDASLARFRRRLPLCEILGGMIAAPPERLPWNEHVFPAAGSHNGGTLNQRRSDALPLAVWRAADVLLPGHLRRTREPSALVRPHLLRRPLVQISRGWERGRGRRTPRASRGFRRSRVLSPASRPPGLPASSRIRVRVRVRRRPVLRKSLHARLGASRGGGVRGCGVAGFFLSRESGASRSHAGEPAISNFAKHLKMLKMVRRWC